MLRRIRNGVQHILDIILLIESSCRTGRDTLAAGYTACVAQRKVKCSSDIGSKASSVGPDDAHGLDLIADRAAAPAKDTFIVVTDHMGRRGIQLVMILFPCKIILIVYPKLFTKLL